MALRIPRPLLLQIFEQARQAAPLEACGLIAGLAGLAQAVIPMTNSDQSTDHFTMDPREQFAAIKAIRAAGQQLLAVYHSHPSSPARPSAEDIRLALTPEVTYLIISLAEGPEPVARAFLIQDGLVQPEELEVTEDEIHHQDTTKRP